MAGSPPPPDAPSPDAQDAVSLDAGFQPGPAAADLCGFKFPPSFKFKFGLNLNIQFPPPIPIPRIGIGISCDLNNPIDVSASLEFGGGRKPLFDPDPDLEEAA